MVTLHFNLIRQWWETHQNGKEDEYREITGYWVQRLFVQENGDKIIKFFADVLALYIKRKGKASILQNSVWRTK